MQRPITEEVEKQDIIKQLTFFNEKVSKIKEGSFAKYIFRLKSGIRITAKAGEGVGVLREGPNEESIDAFILTFRFFIQNRESSSFANLAKSYNSGLIHENHKNEFNATREKLNGFLDENSNVKIKDKMLTNREIMWNFIYGDLAHSDRRDIFKVWKDTTGPFFPILQNDLVWILAIIVNRIYCIEKINKKVLQTFGVKNEALEPRQKKLGSLDL